MIYSEWTPHHWFGESTSSLQMKYYESLIKLSDKVVAITDAQKRMILKGVRVSEDHVSVIPHGIDLKEFSQKNRYDLRVAIRSIHNISQNDPVLLFVGRLDTYKGVEDAIIALSNLLEIYPNARLFLVGPPGSCNMRKLKDYIASKRMEDNVFFIGMIERSKLIAYYYASDIFIFPSRLEGFGIVLAEAMAAGLPVIVYDLPPINSVVGNDSGILVPLGSPKALASAASKLLQDRVLYERCSYTGQQKAEKQYNIEVVTNHYILVYIDLISHRGLR
ncbi:MAG: glycosyltransferase family 4 protein [Thermoproteota archaeon]